MSGFRFSLAALVGVVCVAAVVFGAWRHDPQYGAAVIGALTLTTVASAIVIGCIGNQASRRRWLPFGVFAGCYGCTVWLWWYEMRPSNLLVALVMGSPNLSMPGDPTLAVADSGFTVLFGFLGMVIFHFYWKHHPPESGGERSKPPE